MASGTISHRGTIASLSDGKAKVSIVSTSACASCHAAGLCGSSESAEKTIEASFQPWQSFTVGQEVLVSYSRKLGFKAVLLSYVIPLILLLLIVLLLSPLLGSELLSGLAGLGGVALWYLALYFFRDALKGEYEFVMTPLRDTID
ncbi:MAG: SoxR reducing system RseC family protein [Candidatus Cryptobacteroides sp.]